MVEGIRGLIDMETPPAPPVNNSGAGGVSVDTGQMR